jgi:hypothetical protein
MKPHHYSLVFSTPPMGFTSFYSAHDFKFCVYSFPIPQIRNYQRNCCLLNEKLTHYVTFGREYVTFGRDCLLEYSKGCQIHKGHHQEQHGIG